ncbi:MAG: hypothetical protein ACR2L5_03740 [Candidatus Actinomarinaceae bacterium]
MNDFNFVGEHWLKHGLNHLSPTQKNKPLCGWWYEYVYRDQEWRRKKKPNAKMFAGVSAQIGWDNFALFDKSIDESVDLAVKDYQKRKGTFIDDEKEMKQFEVNLEAIPATVKNYIQALKDLEIKRYKTINSERYVNHWMDGIDIPWTGRTDMETEEFFIEAKTKWQRRSGKPRKDGSYNYGKVAIPQTPDKAHIDQVSFYRAATKKEGYLIYATPYEYKVFSTSQSSAISAEVGESCMKDFYRTALTRQNLVKLSDDAEHIAKNFIQPDFNNIDYYGYTPEELEEVKNFYGR